MSDRDDLADKIDDALSPRGVLGVSYYATNREIRAAYIKLAKEFHPDNWPDDPATEIRFKRITEAYHILSGRHSYSGSLNNRPAPNGRFSYARVLALAAFFFLVAPGIILFVTRSDDTDTQSHELDQAASSSSQVPSALEKTATVINIPAREGSAIQNAFGEPEQGQRELAKLNSGEQEPSSKDIGGADVTALSETAATGPGMERAPADDAPLTARTAANSNSDSAQLRADLRNEGPDHAPKVGSGTLARDKTGTQIASAQPQAASQLRQKNLDRPLTPKIRALTVMGSSSGNLASNVSGQNGPRPAQASPAPGESTARFVGTASTRMNDILAGGL